jgi:hypothetical protein
MNLINTHEAAARLARAIVSDIALYNKEKVLVGIKKDILFDILQEEIEEGEKFYHERVDPELSGKTNYFNKAIVDVLVKRSGNIESDIW